MFQWPLTWRKLLWRGIQVGSPLIQSRSVPVPPAGSVQLSLFYKTWLWPPESDAKSCRLAEEEWGKEQRRTCSRRRWAQTQRPPYKINKKQTTQKKTQCIYLPVKVCRWKRQWLSACSPSLMFMNHHRNWKGLLSNMTLQLVDPTITYKWPGKKKVYSYISLQR